MSLRHPFLSIDVPDTFEKVAPLGDVTFQWTGTNSIGLELLVTIGMRAPSPGWAPRRELEGHIARTLTQKSRGMRVLGEPVWSDDGRIVSVTCELEYSLGQRSIIRLATTKTAMIPPAELGLTHLVHPLVRIALYAMAEEIDAHAHIVTSAVIAPRHGDGTNAGARELFDDLDHVFPYLITDQYVADRDGALIATDRSPQGAAGLTRAGRGLWLALVHDFGARLRVLFPADIAQAGLRWDDCVKRAQMNLRSRVGTEELPLGVVDVPEPPALLPRLAPWRVPHFRVDGLPAFKMLVVGESWLAASCLFAPDLRAGAAEALGTDRLLALAPHRDRLFVFADRGQVANAQVVEQILAIESDGAKPLTPSLFRLDPDGPREILAS